jgi:hypothetical protein
MGGRREYVIAANLERIIADNRHLACVRDAVDRVHRITVDATELLALHVTRCMEAGVPLPQVDASWIKVLMMEVSAGAGKRARVDQEVTTTRTALMPNLQPVSRKALDQLLMAQAISLAAAFDTNLWYHFRKRVLRFVRLHHPVSDNLTKSESKMLKVQILRIASDVCKPRGQPFESDEAHHAWIEEWRRTLRLAELTEWSMEANVDQHQCVLLHASWTINRALEDAGHSCFSCTPVRRRMRPAFCNLDAAGVRDLLQLDRSYLNEQARRRAENTKWRKNRNARNLTRRSEANLPVCPRVRLTDEARKTWSAPADGARAIVVLQRHWRARFAARMQVRLLPLDSVEPGPRWLQLARVQAAVRGWRQRRADEVRRQRQTLDDSKAAVWGEVLHLHKNVRVPKGMRFAGSMRTDGVSARLFFVQEDASTGAKSRGTKRKRSSERAGHSPNVDTSGIPRPGIYTIDALKHYSRLRAAQIIGADPGKRELLVCSDIDEVSERLDGKVASVRYTSAQRRWETLARQHDRQKRAELPEGLRAANEALTAHNSRSSYTQRLADYFATRRRTLDEALAHHARLECRRRAWTRFIRGKQSLSAFVRRIRSLSRGDGPMVIAYGSWANVAGRPGAPCNRGLPPCLGVGLRRELGKHFIIAVTPEQWTSQTCSACGDPCGPCREVDEVHRAKRSQAATTDEQRAKAARYSVRGLRRCSNAACAVFHNRDYNSSILIGRRCKDMLLSVPDSVPDRSDDIDRELASLDAELHDRF